MSRSKPLFHQNITPKFVILFTMDKEKLEHLEEIKDENIVWGIYIFIVFAALLSNKLEEDYILTGSKNDYDEFHKINLIILSIGFFIYVYFLYRNFQHINKKRSIPNYLSLISSILFITAGALLIFAESYGGSFDDEVAI